MRVRRGGAASPRSRGWTLHPQPPPGGAQGFPALAGMDPALTAAMPSWHGLPRARGDGPRVWTLRHIWETASPRSRGWTRAPAGRAPDRWGFPALAGMDPPAPGCRTDRPGLPRARGDGPSRTAGSGRAGWASPRSRGWTWDCPATREVVGGFPALAGMDLNMATVKALAIRLPRARGDGPALSRRDGDPRMASPRSRGWTRTIPA